GGRLERRRGHQRRGRVVEVDPVPASRRLATPAVELGWGGGEGGRSSGRHVGKGRGMGSGAQVVPFAAEAAARRVPLKRPCAVSSLTRAESRVHPRTGHGRLIGMRQGGGRESSASPGMVWT